MTKFGSGVIKANLSFFIQRYEGQGYFTYILGVDGFGHADYHYPRARAQKKQRTIFFFFKL